MAIAAPGFPLLREFYERGSVEVAQALLGKTIARCMGSEYVSGVIAETEAYRGADDPASHAYRGRTPRNSVMFERGGLAYVYFIYGKNWCLNVTTEPRGQPGAVLIRALEPISGRDTMAKRRGVEDPARLASGPGMLTQALGITGAQNGVDMTRRGELYICDSPSFPEFFTVASQRIGVKAGSHLPWRFRIKDSPFVSRG